MNLPAASSGEFNPKRLKNKDVQFSFKTQKKVQFFFNALYKLSNVTI